MHSPSRPAHVLLRIAAVVALALTVAAPGVARAQSPLASPGDQSACAVVEGAADCTPTATPIEPDPGVTDAHPTPWDHVVVAADGRSLDVYFWMGVTDCYGLQSVAVRQGQDGLSIALMTGQASGSTADRVCIEIAQLYVTSVTLDQPLIGNVS
jgi:hypothetical protein